MVQARAAARATQQIDRSENAWLLLAGLVRTGTSGERITRVATRIIELNGEPGDGGEAGQSSGGQAGEGGSDGMVASGARAPAEGAAGGMGGTATGGTATAAGAGAADDGVDHNRAGDGADPGCDCRTVAPSSPATHGLWLAALVAALVRRRSAARDAATAARS